MDPCGRSWLARGESRRSLLRHWIVGGSAIAVGATWWELQPAAAEAAPSKAQDVKIFNFALLLEYLQAAFYTDGVAKGGLRGEVASFAETVSEHERDHVAYLRRALGRKAQRPPTFEFGVATKDEKSFVRTAVLLENLGVAAYNGQAANLTKPSLAAAAEIVSVEGRHAAWISDIGGRDPAPRAADPGASAARILRTIHRTGFLKQ